MINRGHARHPVAVGMSDDHRRPAVVPDHRGDIAREVMQRDVAHRGDRLADPARLRAQHAEAGLGDACATSS
jgi:hypothetical protein